MNDDVKHCPSLRPTSGWDRPNQHSKGFKAGLKLKLSFVEGTVDLGFWTSNSLMACSIKTVKKKKKPKNLTNKNSILQRVLTGLRVSQHNIQKVQN